MNEIDEIRNRIINRRNDHNDHDADLRKLEKKYSKGSKLYKMTMFILLVMAIFMSIALYAKKDENGKFLKENVGINVNFVSFNKTMNKLINFRAVETVTNTSTVSNNPKYVYLGNDLYMLTSNEVLSIDDGVVTYISEEDDGYTLIVENDSGFRSVYSTLIDVNVKVNDRVYANSVLGISNEKVKIVFTRESKKIEYEEVLQLL